MPWTPRHILSPWTPDQARVAACFPQRRRVACPAANGVGKTFLAADLVVSFLADMEAACIILTAPTNRQVRELLWPHVADRLRQVGLAEPEWRMPVDPKWRGEDGDTLIGFATNAPERMQGFHARRMLIVMDEASGMPLDLVEALEGIAVAEENYILAIGNPNQATGAFFDMTRRPSWHTEPISALTHPNVLARKEVIPGATTWTSLVDRVRDWCTEIPDLSPQMTQMTQMVKDNGDLQDRDNDPPLSVSSVSSVVKPLTSDFFVVEISDAELGAGPSTERRVRRFAPNDAFRVRYLGQFPLSDESALIRRDWVERAMYSSRQSAVGSRQLSCPQSGMDGATETDASASGAGALPTADCQLPTLPGRPRIAALDVARFGGDRTVYGLRVGERVEQIRVLPAADLMTQARRVASLVKADAAEWIAVDAAGLGVGLVDRLRELVEIQVVDFQGSGEPRTGADRKQCLNRRAAAYGRLAKAFEQERIQLPPDAGLADELAAIRYRHTADRKLQIEEKQQIRQRLGRSPDVADMVSLLWECGEGEAAPMPELARKPYEG